MKRGERLGERRARRVRRDRARAAVVLALIAALMGVGPVSANAATPWTSVAVPAVANLSLSGVACSGATCVATGATCAPIGCAGFAPGAVLFSPDDGSTWADATLPANVGNLSHPTCANGADCLVIGETAPPGTATQAAVLFTNDLGAKWQLEPVPAASLSGVACPAYWECYAGGVAKSGAPVLLHSKTFGAAWTRVRLPATVVSLGAVNCSSVNDCVAFASSRAGVSDLTVVTTNAGQTWRLGHLPAGFASVAAEGCLSAVRCVVAGNSTSGRVGLVASTLNGGVTWRALTRMTGTLTMSGVSCDGPATCVAVGTSSNPTLAPVVFETTDRAAKWLSQPVPPTTANLDGGVACEPGGVCVAVGQWFTFNGTTATDSGPYVVQD